MHFFVDAAAGAIKAIDTVDPTRYFVRDGENTWAAVKGYLDEVTAVAAARHTRRDVPRLAIAKRP
jgi:hypothetical protein